MGTPNGKTLDLVSRLTENSYDVVQELLNTLPQLEPAQKAKVLMDLMGFIYPKRKALEFVPSEVDATDDQDQRIDEYKATIQRLHSMELEKAKSVGRAEALARSY